MANTEKPKAKKLRTIIKKKKIKIPVDKKTKENIVVDSENSQEKLLEFTGLDGKNYHLTFKQKKFCLKYLELYGNGTQACIEAGYNCYTAGGNISYRLAAAIASENLTKPNIYAYVNLKMEEYGFNEDNVMKQHLFLINQHADLPAKAKGIDMFYKIKGSYAPEKHQTDFSARVEEALDRLSKVLPDTGI